jgi:hypothetical protein
LPARIYAQRFFAASLRCKSELRTEVVNLNGEWSLLLFTEGALE